MFSCPSLLSNGHMIRNMSVQFLKTITGMKKLSSSTKNAYKYIYHNKSGILLLIILPDEPRTYFFFSYFCLSIVVICKTMRCATDPEAVSMFSFLPLLLFPFTTRALFPVAA